MVTVKKLRAVGAARAADYFSDIERQRSTGDYYAGKQGEAVERPGQWLGSMAASLGLSGDVSVEQLVRLLDGCHPGSGERLIPYRQDSGGARHHFLRSQVCLSPVGAGLR